MREREFIRATPWNSPLKSRWGTQSFKSYLADLFRVVSYHTFNQPQSMRVDCHSIEISLHLSGNFWAKAHISSSYTHPFQSFVSGIFRGRYWSDEMEYKQWGLASRVRKYLTVPDLTIWHYHSLNDDNLKLRKMTREADDEIAHERQLNGRPLPLFFRDRFPRSIHRRFDFLGACRSKTSRNSTTK